MGTPLPSDKEKDLLNAITPQPPKVVAFKASLPLHGATQQRCEPYLNVAAVHGDVLAFEPEDRYELVFLGGMLVYLNESDVIALLRKLVPFLDSGGIILCRETTVRKGAPQQNLWVAF